MNFRKTLITDSRRCVRHQGSNLARCLDGTIPKSDRTAHPFSDCRVFTHLTSSTAFSQKFRQLATLFLTVVGRVPNVAPELLGVKAPKGLLQLTSHRELSHGQICC